MKQVLLFILIGFPLVFHACMQDTAKPPKQDVSGLTLEDKAANTFKNTTAVFSGSMLLAFSNHFRPLVDSFAVLFDGELSDEGLQYLDDQIANLDSNTLQTIDRMIVQIDSAVDALRASNRISLYQKMFMNDLIRDGIAITEKYELPYGFRPLCLPLSDKEIKRYILKVTTDSHDPNDPLIKTYMELFAWFQEVGEDFQADPEIQEFLNSMRR